MLIQLLVGGNETTTSLIANTVWRLLERPDLWRAVVADPARIPAAVEESLRFDPPVLGLFRNTTRAVTLHGVKIPAGSKVMLHYGAAHRDPSVYEGADTFRLEARVALERLTSRCPDLDVIDAGERIAPFFLWGRRRLPARTSNQGAQS